MIIKTKVSKILWYEAFGFAAIIAFSWFFEFTDLSYFVGGVESSADWREGVVETLVVLIVAIPVMVFTKRMVAQLYYLEGFMRVCAWCRKAEHHGEWSSMESFFENNFETLTSHGICPDCFDRIKNSIE